MKGAQLVCSRIHIQQPCSGDHALTNSSSCLVVSNKPLPHFFILPKEIPDVGGFYHHF